eukprot:gene5365-2709_t
MFRYLPERPPADPSLCDLSDDATFHRLLRSAATDGVSAPLLRATSDALAEHAGGSDVEALRARCAVLNAVGFRVEPRHLWIL